MDGSRHAKIFVPGTRVALGTRSRVEEAGKGEEGGIGDAGDKTPDPGGQVPSRLKQGLHSKGKGTKGSGKDEGYPDPPSPSKGSKRTELRAGALEKGSLRPPMLRGHKRAKTNGKLSSTNQGKSNLITEENAKINAVVREEITYL